MTGNKLVRVDPKADIAEALAGFSDALAPATRRAYESAWKDWLSYATAASLDAFPVEAGFLVGWLMSCERRGLSISALRKRVAAVRERHRAQGVASPSDHPSVALHLKATARRLAGRTVNPKRAITISMLEEMVLALDGKKAVRDRAILLVGLVTGMRRSELAALTWADRTVEGDGIVLRIQRSKTDQEGKGRSVGVPPNTGNLVLCPVFAISTWEQQAPREKPTMFECGDRTISNVIKRACVSVGLDPAEFGGHSLRRGMITEARRAGVQNSDVMAQSGHRSESMLATYTEDITASKNPAAQAIVDRLGRQDDEV